MKKRWTWGAVAMLMGAALCVAPPAFAQDDEGDSGGEAASGSLQRSTTLGFECAAGQKINIWIQSQCQDSDHPTGRTYFRKPLPVMRLPLTQG